MDRFSAHMDRAWDLVSRGETSHALICAKKALEIDDKKFQMQTPVWHEPVPGGKVEVEIEEI